MKITLLEKIVITTIVLIIICTCSGVYLTSVAISRIKESNIESNRFIKDNNCKIIEKTDGIISKEKYICNNSIRYER